MTQKQKSIHVLTGLGDDVFIGTPEEVTDSRGRTIVQIPVTNRTHTRICPDCGGTDVYICDSGRDCRAWHIPQGKRKPCRVVFHRERYVCRGCGRSFMEQIPWIHENSHMTAALYDCIKKDLHSYTTLKEIARVNCISVYFVSLVIKSLRLPVPSSLPEVVCLDETHSEVEEHRPDRKDSAWVRFTTNFSDGTDGRLLDILPFRTKKRLAGYFNSNFPLSERKKVKFLCCDMGPQYLYLAEQCFPNATVCLDNYHVTNRLNKAVNDVRIKEQNHLLDIGDNEAYADLKHLSRRLVTSIYNQHKYWRDSEDSIFGRLMAQFEASPELKDAYAMLQYFHELFHSSSSYDIRCEQLDLWISVFSRSTSEIIYRTVQTVSTHIEYIHNAWKNGLSNAVCEGNNNAIQTVKTMSFGIHSFDYFRKRMLLVIGNPGVSRSLERNDDGILLSGSLFFQEFPSLEEYTLAYDWSHPHSASKPVI